MGVIQGGCYCGKINYTLEGNPTGFQHCHCKQCQHIHGASFVTWVGFRGSKFTIHDPENVLHTFDSGRANRSFCSNCGSHLHFFYRQPDTSKAQENVNYVAAPSLKTPVKLDANLNEPRFRHLYHVYTDEQPEWTKDFVKLINPEPLAS